jgi:outer membrane protein assembly factor BamB
VKRKILIATLLGVFLFGPGNINAQLADSPWPMYHGGPRHGGQSKIDTSHVDGTIKWKFKTGGGIESSPAIGADGTIYVGSHDNKLYAVNPDGTLKWKFSAGEPSYDDIYKVTKGILASPAVAKNGTIYFSSLSDKFFAINPDGTEKWRYEVPITSDTWTSPVIGKDGTIYTGAARRKFEGSQEQEYYEDPISGIYAFTPNGKLKWRFTSKSDMPGSIAVGDDGIIYAFIGESETKMKWVGYLKAITAGGKEKWKYPIIFSESSPAIAPDGSIYMGAGHENKGFLALNPDGTENWFFPTKDDISSIPAIGSDGTIYVGVWDGIFYAFSPDGEVKWSFKTPKKTDEEITTSAAIGAEGAIYFGTGSGYFYALNSDGTLKWKYNTKSAFSSSAAIGADGTIYVGAWDKNLYAFTGPEKEKDSTGSATKETEKKGVQAIYYVAGAAAIIIILVISAGVIIFLRRRKTSSK